MMSDINSISFQVTPFNIFVLDTNFNKSIVRLEFLLIFYMFVKFQDDLRPNNLMSSFYNKNVHKRWASKSNSKWHPSHMKLGIYIKKIEEM